MKIHTPINERLKQCDITCGGLDINGTAPGKSNTLTPMIDHTPENIKTALTGIIELKIIMMTKMWVGI